MTSIRAEGKGRILRELVSYSLWEDGFAPRIRAVAGNLAEPMLRLVPETYRMLADEVGVIYHNGSQLNLTQSYVALRLDNVLGTKGVLRLACRRRLKAVHFVSSLGVCELRAAGEVVVHEGDVPNDLEGLRCGYMRTKAVAELLVREAGARGIPVTIYRPGLVNASATNGASAMLDFVARLLRSWVVLG